MEDITILVNSCDLYSSVWEPFFKLFNIQWPDCPYRIVLNTESKKYNCDFLDVQTISGGVNIPWSRRLRNVLEQIDSKYIIYLLDDFFLMSKVNAEGLNEAINMMKKDNEIGYIGLKHNNQHIFKKGFENNKEKRFFLKDEVKTINRVNSMSALWRREWLLSLLRDHETPWEFEIYGSIRSRRTNFKVLQINSYIVPSVFDYEVDYQYGYGISQRKWLKGNKALFEKYGIDVNYEELGWLDIEKQKTIESEKQGRKKLEIIEKLYNVKRYVRKSKKWIIKTERKIRSLI